MLVGLIRLTHLARMLGVDPDTAQSWLARINYQPVQCPTIGLPDSGTRSPRYVSIEAAVRLCDLMLPVVVDRAANARAKRQARTAARQLEESTRNIRHIGVPGWTHHHRNQRYSSPARILVPSLLTAHVTQNLPGDSRPHGDKTPR